MSRTFTLADSQTLDDLQVFLARAARIEEGSVRLIAGSGVLAVYAAVLYPVGLLDESPTVLGLRTFALAPNADGIADEFDVVVPIRSLLDPARDAQGVRPPTRDHGHVTISLPMEVNTVTWAAISPPRGGWHPISATTGAVLDAAARAGIDEVAAAIPDAVGEQIVRRVRSEVWARADPRAGARAGGRRLRGARARLPRRRRGARLRDRPVDAPHDAARSRPGEAQGLDAGPLERRRYSSSAIARPACRPVNRHPPRNVPSSAR